VPGDGRVAVRVHRLQRLRSALISFGGALELASLKRQVGQVIEGAHLA
jgi:hypothetical protein